MIASKNSLCPFSSSGQDCFIIFLFNLQLTNAVSILTLLFINVNTKDKVR